MLLACGPALLAGWTILVCAGDDFVMTLTGWAAGLLAVAGGVHTAVGDVNLAIEIEEPTSAHGRRYSSRRVGFKPSAVACARRAILEIQRFSVPLVSGILVALVWANADPSSYECTRPWPNQRGRDRTREAVTSMASQSAHGVVTA